jgi:hypothetical protein
MDKLAIESGEPLRGKPVVGRITWPGGLDEDIGAGDHPFDRLPPGRACRVEPQKPLVDVERPPLGAINSGSRQFDLDNIGAQIGENTPGQPAQPAAEIDNLVASKHGVRPAGFLLRAVLPARPGQRQQPAMHARFGVGDVFG